MSYGNKRQKKNKTCQFQLPELTVFSLYLLENWVRPEDNPARYMSEDVF